MEKAINKTCRLPIHAHRIMTYINRTTGLNNFILYGGVPIDKMINRKCRINDYDLAINSKESRKIKEVIKFLINNGFDIIESNRKYYIYNNIEVILIYARKGKILLDICFMDDINLVGQFNAESLYWKYPEMECIDKYNALTSIKEKKLALIREIEKENIFLLISRFLYLCSKYNISLFGDGHKCVNSFNKRLLEMNNGRSEQFVSCLSSIFKSILKAKNRKIFIMELVDSGLIRIIFPSLDIALTNFLQNKCNKKSISKIKDKKELLIFLENFLNKKNDKDVFKETVKILSKRIWDKQDARI